MNFYDLLVDRAREFGEKIFLRVDERRLTYDEFLAEVRAARLAIDGDNVLIAAEGWLEQLTNFFAAQAFKKRPILLHHGMTRADVSIEGGGSEDVLGVLTSGSSGKPKILFRTFDSWAKFFPVQNSVFGIDENSTLFMHGSLSFTGNLNALLSTLSAGGTIVTSEKFNVRSWIGLIDGCSAIYLVPTKLNLLASIDRELGSVKTIFTGSQLVNAKLYRRLMKQFPAARLIIYYGASELNYITYKIIDERNVGETNNLGRAFDGVGVFVRDGLIYVDNAFGVSGLKMPTTVGDAGRINDVGELIFEGRSADFINKGGYKISAARIERLLQSIEEISAAAVKKIRDERRGENFIAFVVAENRNAVEKKIRQLLKPIEQPARLIFVKELPLNDRGKVDFSTVVTL